MDEWQIVESIGHLRRFLLAAPRVSCVKGHPLTVSRSSFPSIDSQLRMLVRACGIAWFFSTVSVLAHVCTSSSESVCPAVTALYYPLTGRYALAPNADRCDLALQATGPVDSGPSTATSGAQERRSELDVDPSPYNQTRLDPNVIPRPDLTPSHQKRYNYASLDCSARIHSASPLTQHSSSLLHKSRDRYMITPCKADQHWVVVELCDEIRVEAIELDVWEFFSGVVREIRLSVGEEVEDRHKWEAVDTFVGRNVRGTQVGLQRSQH